MSKETDITKRGVRGRSLPRKVRLDVTIPAEHKRKLMEHASARSLSVSLVIQLMIEKYCK